MSNIFAMFWLLPVAAVLALVFAWYFFKNMMKNSEGTDRMKEIGGISYWWILLRSLRIPGNENSNICLCKNCTWSFQVPE